MQSEQQFEQLMMQYTQLKNGALDIRSMLEHENFDEVINMLKFREDMFLNCKCIRNYLELTPVQQKELDKLLDELRVLELENIKILETEKSNVQRELQRTSQLEKIQQAYDFDENQKGSIINYTEE